MTDDHSSDESSDESSDGELYHKKREFKDNKKRSRDNHSPEGDDCPDEKGKNKVDEMTEEDTLEDEEPEPKRLRETTLKRANDGLDETTVKRRKLRHYDGSLVHPESDEGSDDPDDMPIRESHKRKESECSDEPEFIAPKRLHTLYIEV